MLRIGGDDESVGNQYGAPELACLVPALRT